MSGEKQESRAAKAPELNNEKARRAARHPDRPGEKCGADPGAFRPVINRNSCEGKRDCVEVCPYNVFELGRIDDEDFAELSFFGKLKSRAHARQTSYTPNANLCQACGLCVVACPEKRLHSFRICVLEPHGICEELEADRASEGKPLPAVELDEKSWRIGW